MFNLGGPVIPYGVIETYLNDFFLNTNLFCKEMHFKMPSANCRPCYSGLNAMYYLTASTAVDLYFHTKDNDVNDTQSWIMHICAWNFLIYSLFFVVVFVCLFVCLYVVVFCFVLFWCFVVLNFRCLQYGISIKVDNELLRIKVILNLLYRKQLLCWIIALRGCMWLSYPWSSDCFPWTLQWRLNKRDGVSNHQPHDCLLNFLFKAQIIETSKLRVTGLCEGNSPVTGEFPTQWVSNAENVSLGWHHHALGCC